MELVLARDELNKEQKSITLQEITKELEKDGQKIFYFDQSNSHKDLVSLVEYFEEQNASVYLREIKYGLDDSDYIYEVHILLG